MSIWSPLPRKLQRPFVIAHRGLPEIALENTRRSYELALEAGTDTVETDVHVTADGRVVCLHDEDLLRVAGSDLRIQEVTIEEARAAFPALLEYETFLQMTGDMPVMIDTKGASVEDFQVIAGVTERASLTERIIFTAYTFELARAIRARFPEVAISIHANRGLDPLKMASEVKASCIRLLASDYVPDHIAKLHAQGYATIAVAAPLSSTRTSTSPDALREIAKLGIAAIITDRCDWAMETLAATDSNQA
ncbi:glycerophosphodiester phosphodiesterase [Rhizobium miluonense]|uniref:Glycerophosphoryl diester phosphodiesterase n=1 Tax=Rhizobium miluonense TaxID=411945 RepID=A0A1C3WDP2_9HYPH|nr:glycerophosphodiester phosphodiesterase family protein [Rhizobium miluonense]SCB37968.1 glycerophosphoryl diester phosphodiesterase [Rhizobium miluonense]